MVPMTALERAVLTPIVFFDLFDRPIRLSGLRRLLYRQPASPASLKRTLGRLESAGKIFRRQGFIRLNGRRGLIQNALAREQISEDLWLEAQILIEGLGAVPFVRMIAVVNSLAFHNANQNSDIDLLVVTEPGMMSVARDYLTAHLVLWGRRNTRGPKRGKLAADVFLDTEHLDVSDFHGPGQDIYVDYWAASIAPVIDRDNTYQRFLEANSWIQETFPGFVPHTEHTIVVGRGANWRRAVREQWYRSALGRPMAKLLTKWQLWRLRRYQRDSTVGMIEVGPHRLRFHVPDRRAEYQRAFEATWQSLNN